MKRYALLNMENENIIFQDRLTNKFLEIIKDNFSILFYYDDFMKKYIPFQNNLKKDFHIKYNNNVNYYQSLILNK